MNLAAIFDVELVEDLVEASFEKLLGQALCTESVGIDGFSDEICHVLAIECANLPRVVLLDDILDLLIQ